MTYQQERYAIDRYMKMYDEYYGGTSARLRSARSYASAAYIENNCEGIYHDDGDLEDSGRLVRDDTA